MGWRCSRRPAERDSAWPRLLQIRRAKLKTPLRRFSFRFFFAVKRFGFFDCEKRGKESTAETATPHKVQATAPHSTGSTSPKENRRSYSSHDNRCPQATAPAADSSCPAVPGPLLPRRPIRRPRSIISLNRSPPSVVLSKAPKTPAETEQAVCFGFGKTT